MLDLFWLGTQSAYDVYAESKPKITEKLVAGVFDDDEDSDMSDFSLLKVDGNIGTITINGSLVDGNPGFFGSWFGIVGYGDIQNALVQAVKDPRVSAIVLDISSGGGQVSGVSDTAKLVAMVDAIKPVVTYTGSMMASAALWLGSSARRMFVGETAIAGSIGVLMVHKSYAGQLEKNGIKATVIRAGEFKALSNPYENLSEAAIAKMEAQAEYMYDIFLGWVADRRGLSKTAADTKFGQGREFIGQQGVDAGLIDEVGSFAQALAYVNALPQVQRDNTLKVGSGTVASNTIESDNSTQPKGNEMPGMNITPEQLAAMAAGVNLEEEQAAPAAPALIEGDKTPDATEALKAEVASLKTELEAVKTGQNELLDTLANIAKASMKTMTVALGGTAASVEALAAADIPAKHAEVTEQFKAKFKTGGVAAPHKQEEAPVAALVNPLFVYAVQSSKTK